MNITTFLTVVQRRPFSVEAEQAYLIPLLTPLFYIETHMSYEERLRLFQSAVELQNGFVACELGSYLGASTAFLAAAASLKSGHVHAVDTWNNDAVDHEPTRDTFAEFCKNTDPYRQTITTHRGQAHALVHEIPLVDLFFLDGDHSYEAVKRDLEDYVPRIKPGGVLLLHDFTYESVQHAFRDYIGNRTIVDMGLTHSLQVFQLP